MLFQFDDEVFKEAGKQAGVHFDTEEYRDSPAGLLHGRRGLVAGEQLAVGRHDEPELGAGARAAGAAAHHARRRRAPQGQQHTQAGQKPVKTQRVRR